MSHQYVHVIVPRAKVDDIIKLAERDGVTFVGISAVKGPLRTISFLATLKAQQALIDDLQRVLHNTRDWKIALLPVGAVVTKSPEDEDDRPETSETREELLSEISHNAGITSTFLVLVAISALVAALGMIRGDVAVIIGAMVIAPLLGPLLGTSLGVALGERQLIVNSVKANIAGFALAVGVGTLLGIVLNFDLSGQELAARAHVGYENIALALAAGAAAAMSLTAGAASVLVGVMVAVALLPPATAIGLFLGKAAWAMAGKAAILLAVNVAALILSGQIVFLIRGIQPRTRYRRAKVRQSVWFSLAVSGALLAVLALLIGYQILQGT